MKILINYIKHYRATSKNDVIKFKCLSKIIMFKSDIFIINAFLNFYYNKYICVKMIRLLLNYKLKKSRISRFIIDTLYLIL